MLTAHREREGERVTDSTSTPAGWYADPDQQGYERYWDGSQWTEHTQPIPGDAAAQGAAGMPGQAPPASSGQWPPGPPTGAPAPPPNVAPIPPWQAGGPSGPGFGPPPAKRGGGNKTALIVALIVVAALVAVGAIIALAGGGDDDDTDTASDTTSGQSDTTSGDSGTTSGDSGTTSGDSGTTSGGPTDPNPDDEFVAPNEPPGGDDEALNALADDCYGGDMAACDELFSEAPVGSDYESYGDTCAGRMPDPQGRYCEDTIEDPILP